MNKTRSSLTVSGLGNEYSSCPCINRSAVSTVLQSPQASPSSLKCCLRMCAHSFLKAFRNEQSPTRPAGVGSKANRRPVDSRRASSRILAVNRCDASADSGLLRPSCSPTRQIAPASLNSFSAGPSGTYASIRHEAPLRISSPTRRTSRSLTSFSSRCATRIFRSADANSYRLPTRRKVNSTCLSSIGAICWNRCDTPFFAVCHRRRPPFSAPHLKSRRRAQLVFVCASLTTRFAVPGPAITTTIRKTPRTTDCQ